MEMTVRSTSRMILLVLRDGREIPARVWEGETTTGVPVVALITRVAAEADGDCTAFERDLVETPAPGPLGLAVPARLVL
jgi:hypothetical protein